MTAGSNIVAPSTISSGKFPKIKTGASTLWTSIKRSFDGNFGLSDGYPLKDANFSNLLLSDADLNDFSKECMFMVYDKDVKKFRGKQEDCEAKVHSPLCQVRFHKCLHYKRSPVSLSPVSFSSARS